MENFIEQYLDYYKETEPPPLFHRWCAISGISALMGRNCFVQHGHSKIYPNLYVMLVGEAGSRKSTAIHRIKKLLKDIDYNKITADKTTKEKFLIDLEEGIDVANSGDDRVDVTKGNVKNPTMKQLFGLELSSEPADCLIAADELNAFLGHNNVEFIDLLTQLWDYDGIYQSRIKNGKSVRINNPTISLLGGNTNVGISQAFPPEVIGQGFFSRLISVFSEPSGKRFTFPPVPNPEDYQKLANALREIRVKYRGEIKFTSHAYIALDEIYQTWTDLDDVRFKSYSTRRFTQLLKLCIICTAARKQDKVDTETVIYANSILHFTEHFMPKALGEFGKAKNSDVTAKIIGLLDKAEKPLNIQTDIWPQVSRDLDNMKQLADIMVGLKSGGKIQEVPGGILAKKVPPKFDFPHCKVGMLREFAISQLGKDALL